LSPLLGSSKGVRLPRSVGYATDLGRRSCNTTTQNLVVHHYPSPPPRYRIASAHHRVLPSSACPHHPPFTRCVSAVESIPAKLVKLGTKRNERNPLVIGVSVNAWIADITQLKTPRLVPQRHPFFNLCVCFRRSWPRTKHT
jgi:hypothetical protein